VTTTLSLAASTPAAVDAGNTAWILASSALVMFMTPGLALFYGGLVRAKNVLNMLMMNFICLGLVGVLWVLFGFSLSFGQSRAGGLIGSSSDFYGLGNPDVIGSVWGFGPIYQVGDPLPSGAVTAGVPVLVFDVPADVRDHHTGAHLRRGRRPRQVRGLDRLCGPLGHPRLLPGGQLGVRYRLDPEQAARGGLRRRHCRPHQCRRRGPCPSAGDRQADRLAQGSDEAAQRAVRLYWAYALLVVVALAGVVARRRQLAQPVWQLTLATCAAVLGWLTVEWLRDGKPTTVGAASGAVAGLVAITPACAFVSPLGGTALGLIAGMVCAVAISLKFRFGFDDALDVVGVHLVGGITGTLLIGILGFDHGALAGGVEAKRGLLYGGGLTLLWVQMIAVGAVLGYSFCITYLIGTVLNKMGVLRVSQETEYTGLDEIEHAETAYSFSTVFGGGLVGAGASTSSSSVTAPAGQEV
jgi:Amt family ammonium transporter